jgi:hypothetical protein
MIGAIFLDLYERIQIILLILPDFYFLYMNSFCNYVPDELVVPKINADIWQLSFISLFVIKCELKTYSFCIGWILAHVHTMD